MATEKGSPWAADDGRTMGGRWEDDGRTMGGRWEMTGLRRAAERQIRASGSALLFLAAEIGVQSQKVVKEMRREHFVSMEVLTPGQKFANCEQFYGSQMGGEMGRRA